MKYITIEASESVVWEV